MTVLLEENLHQDWSRMLLYAKRFGDYYFFVFSPMGKAQPPSTPPALGPLDSAMLEELENSLPAMNLEVATSAASARNAPPPAPPTPDSKKFWRIHANWSVDTDGDGSLDWEEFEIAANPSHPSHGLGNAFNADADGNGVADGDQADTDSDGIPNSQDADRGNNVIDWQRADDVRFAWFQVPPPLDPWGGEQWPKQVTDRGHVVFSWGLWSSGSYSNIARSGVNLDNCMILGMNCALGDTIIGTGNYDRNDDGSPDIGCMVSWQNGSPIPIASGDYIATFPFPSYPSNGQFLGNDLGFVGQVYSQGVLDPEMVRWKLPWLGGAGEASFLPVDQWVMSGVSESLLWGGNQATIAGVTSTMPGTYQRLVVTPGNSVLAFSDSSRPALYRNGSWSIQDAFENLVDFSNRGFGVSAFPVTVWNNGKAQSLTVAAPGLPPEWEQKSRFIDLSEAGNLIVSRQQSPSHSPDAFGLGVPIALEDDEEATGVDVTSITSSEPGPGVNNKLWIMAPTEGANALRIKSTAASTCTLALTAPGTTFEPASLTSVDEEMVVSGHGTASTDLAVTISNGSATSLSNPVGMKVMKKRTVRVSVYPVELDLFGEVGGLDYPPEFNLDGVVNGDNVLALALDRIFEKQVAARFIVKVEDKITKNWDVNGDLIFQAAGPDGVLTAEQAKVMEGLPPSTFSPHFRVFVIGGPPPRADLPNNVSARLRGLLDGTNHATTKPNDRLIWISGSNRGGTRTQPMFERTLAHEAGHLFLDWDNAEDPGFGHPDKDGGKAPLPGTDRTRRLMVSGEGQGPNPGKLLVKTEWDRIEEWMKARVDIQ